MLPERAEQLSQFGGEQLGLLGGGDVPAAGHLGAAGDVVGRRGPFAGGETRIDADAARAEFLGRAVVRLTRAALAAPWSMVTAFGLQVLTKRRRRGRKELCLLAAVGGRGSSPAERTARLMTDLSRHA